MDQPAKDSHQGRFWFTLRELLAAVLFVALWMQLSFGLGGAGFCFGLLCLGLALAVWGWSRKLPERVGCPLAVTILLALFSPSIATALDSWGMGAHNSLSAVRAYRLFVFWSGYAYLQCFLFACDNPIRSRFSAWWVYAVYFLQFPVTFMFYWTVEAFLVTSLLRFIR